MPITSSINLGMSGLLGFSAELQNISNNVANLNTPGFKGSDSQFADMFSQDDNLAGGTGQQIGEGLQVLPPVINFSMGQATQTGVATNMMDSGNSFFVLKDPKTGQLYYTQDGQFQFNSSGVLVDSTGNYQVQALNSENQLVSLTQAGLENSAPKASTTITLSGNLSNGTTSTDEVDTVSSINVIDATGGTHALTATFTDSTSKPGTWTVSISDGNGTVVSGGTFVFANGTLTTANGANSYKFTYSPKGVPAMNLTLTLDPSTTNQATGSTLGVESIDGYTGGTVTNTTFDQNGTLVLSYSNGQTANGPSVALANFSSTASLKASTANNNAFVTPDNNQAQLGTAGNNSAWGTINAGSIQASNVDLSTEFSNIIITQRGYQAASEIVSTANQMIQNVLDMKGQS